MKALALIQCIGEFREQFKIAQNIQDLERFVKKLEEAESLLSWGHKVRANVQLSLGSILPSLIEYKSNTTDLDNYTEMLRECVTLHEPSEPGHGPALMNLTYALLHQFEYKRNLEHINEAVELSREALRVCAATHPGHTVALTSLAAAIKARFRQQGDPKDIDEAIKLNRQVLEVERGSNSGRSGTLTNLGIALSARFQQQGDLNDVEEAIILHREALVIGPSLSSDNCILLNSLANAICSRYKRLGDSRDIKEAIELYRKARETCFDPQQHSDTLYNLAGAMSDCCKQLGDSKGLDEVIALNREVLEVGTASNLIHIGARHNLALALQGRFQDRGNRKDIDEAVELLREVVEMCSDTYSHSNRALSNLATAIGMRYMQWEDSRDIDEAIELHRKALEIGVSSYLDRWPFIHNLAVALQIRFERGDMKDIEEAITLHKKALALDTLQISDASYSERSSSSLCNLAIAFYSRGMTKRDEKDNDEAIDLHRKALSIRAAPNLARSNSLSHLAFTLHSRFRWKQDPKDIDEATLASAVSAFQEGSNYMYCPPFLQFSAADRWAKIATMHSHSTSLLAYRTCINLLPRLIAFHLDLKSRQQILTRAEITSLASASSTCAISLNESNVAVEFLEASRSIFWAQALNLRPPLDQLADIRPDLAFRLKELSIQLERASFRDTSENLLADTQANIRSIEAVGTRCRQLNEEWEETIKSVRTIPRFEDFMHPKSIASLRRAAISGPVIILLAGKLSSSALIVTSSQDVQEVQLPEINLETLELYTDLPRAMSDQNFDITSFLKARGHKSCPDQFELEYRLCGAPEGYLNMSFDDIFRKHLAEIWEKIVKPVLEYLNLKASFQLSSKNPPRIWWCPTGQFAFLPIHAVGIYTEDAADCTADYVVSSYTPTLAALLDPPTQTAEAFKITAVVEPSAPNCTPLPGTEEEISTVMDRVPTEWLKALLSPTGSEVIENLHGSSIIHFACHGIQDSKNPLDSGLMLSDGRLKISQIMRKPDNVNTTGNTNAMSLAFLSACETAKGDGSTPDEALHLAATLLFAGFRGVVATMWGIADEDGPRVTDAFYGHLFKACDLKSNHPALPDLTNAAEALHFAVLKLRKEPGITFKRWVPFVHYGL
ncbi:CHAT domain-containing protein [Mycena galopus ATCC 62051]|nr:CHAT domain-containing protein [Mycena galopus ATCC 62051]